MIKNYVVYDTKGEVNYSGVSSQKQADLEADEEEGLSVLYTEKEEDPDEVYVDLSGDKPRLKNKEDFEYTVSVDGLTALIEGLITPTTVYVLGNKVLVEDGELELDVEKAGVYLVKLETPLNYFDKELELNFD